MKQLTIGDIISNAIQIGAQNAISIVGAVVLYVLTIWIPYLNVGTTIGLVGMIAKMGRGQAISPTEIFNPEYRKQMGEFFLVMIFVTMGIYVGILFLVIPGIAIGIAWSLAVLLVLDKGMGPMEAIKKSNDLTYGSKLTIFFASFILEIGIIIVIVVVGGLVGWILGKISPSLAQLFGILLSVVGYVAIMSIMMGAFAYIYNTLVEGGGAAQPVAAAPRPSAPPAASSPVPSSPPPSSPQMPPRNPQRPPGS